MREAKNWATWWVLDGGDDADSLRAADVRGDLNSQVVDATANFLSWHYFFIIIIIIKILFFFNFIHVCLKI